MWVSANGLEYEAGGTHCDVGWRIFAPEAKGLEQLTDFRIIDIRIFPSKKILIPGTLY